MIGPGFRRAVLEPAVRRVGIRSAVGRYIDVGVMMAPSSPGMEAMRARSRGPSQAGRTPSACKSVFRMLSFRPRWKTCGWVGGGRGDESDSGSTLDCGAGMAGIGTESRSSMRILDRVWAKILSFSTCMCWNRTVLEMSTEWALASMAGLALVSSFFNRSAVLRSMTSAPLAEYTISPDAVNAAWANSRGRWCGYARACAASHTVRSSRV